MTKTGSYSNWEYYIVYRSGYINKFLKNNPEFDDQEFLEFVKSKKSDLENLW